MQPRLQDVLCPPGRPSSGGAHAHWRRVGRPHRAGHRQRHDERPADRRRVPDPPGFQANLHVPDRTGSNCPHQDQRHPAGRRGGRSIRRVPALCRRRVALRLRWGIVRSRDRARRLRNGYGECPRGHRGGVTRPPHGHAERPHAALGGSDYGIRQDLRSGGRACERHADRGECGHGPQHGGIRAEPGGKRSDPPQAAGAVPPRAEDPDGGRGGVHGRDPGRRAPYPAPRPLLQRRPDVLRHELGRHHGSLPGLSAGRDLHRCKDHRLRRSVARVQPGREGLRRAGGMPYLHPQHQVPLLPGPAQERRGAAPVRSRRLRMAKAASGHRGGVQGEMIWVSV